MRLPRELVAALQGVRSVGAITGAGLSAESGIPTYRGEGGLYDDPDEGDRTVAALTGSALREDPNRTWRVVADLARRSHDARPNAGHAALVAIEQAVERFALLTQNVDGLHREAGTRNLIAIHGDIFDTRCMQCDATAPLERAVLPTLERAPLCKLCGGYLRPDVVLFEEMLPLAATQRMRDEFVYHVPDLILVAGTTALFPYISSPVLVARRMGRLTVEVNPERTVLSDMVDYFLQAKAGEALPAIAAALSDTPSRRSS